LSSSPVFTAETRSSRRKRGENQSQDFSCFSPCFLRELRVSAVITGLLVFLLSPVFGAIIDRIAVSVGNQVITLRDVEREIRVTAFLAAAKPDLSAANKRATADRLVEQTLIRHEMESSGFPFPAAAEAEPSLENLKKNFPSEADYGRALAEYQITEQDVRDLLLRMLTLEQFTSLRFRPAAQVSAAAIQDYFNRVVAPAARAAHPGQPVELEDYRTQIEEKLTGDMADREMDNWLKEAHKRTEIVVHPEAFE
jgi:hypothetical protein